MLTGFGIHWYVIAGLFALSIIIRGVIGGGIGLTQGLSLKDSVGGAFSLRLNKEVLLKYYVILTISAYLVTAILVVLFSIFYKFNILSIFIPKSNNILLYGLMPLFPIMTITGFICQAGTDRKEDDRSKTVTDNKFMFQLLSVGFIGPVLEEILSRGVLQAGLVNQYGVLVGSAIAAAFFISLHISKLSIMLFVRTFLYTAIYAVYGNIFYCIIFHIAQNLYAVLLGRYKESVHSILNKTPEKIRVMIAGVTFIFALAVFAYICRDFYFVLKG